MAEYIERVRVKELLRSHYFPTDQPYESDRNWAVGFNAGLDKAIHKIHYAPAADVVPVVHGRWEYHDCVCTGDGLISVYACSACQGCIDEEAFDQLYAQNYCPNCGAKMKDGD